MAHPVEGAPVVRGRGHRPAPVRAWVGLLLVLGPVWWIVIPFFVDKVVPLPEVGILIGPLLSFLSAFVGLFLAISTIDRAAAERWSATVGWVTIGLFVAFTLLFAVLFVVFVASGGRATL